MTTLTPDIIGLFAALAAGEDTPERLCPVIADALDDASQPLAGCVRLVLPHALRWLAPEGGEVRRPHHIPPDLWHWLCVGGEQRGCLPVQAAACNGYYFSAANAYLALAEVLAPLVPWHDRRPRRQKRTQKDAAPLWCWDRHNVAPHGVGADKDGVWAYYSSQRDAMLVLLAAVSTSSRHSAAAAPRLRPPSPGHVVIGYEVR